MTTGTLAKLILMLEFCDIIVDNLQLMNPQPNVSWLGVMVDDKVVIGVCELSCPVQGKGGCDAELGI